MKKYLIALFCVTLLFTGCDNSAGGSNDDNEKLLKRYRQKQEFIDYLEGEWIFWNVDDFKYTDYYDSYSGYSDLTGYYKQVFEKNRISFKDSIVSVGNGPFVGSEALVYKTGDKVNCNHFLTFEEIKEKHEAEPDNVKYSDLYEWFNFVGKFHYFSFAFDYEMVNKKNYFLSSYTYQNTKWSNYDYDLDPERCYVFFCVNEVDKGITQWIINIKKDTDDISKTPFITYFSYEREDIFRRDHIISDSSEETEEENGQESEESDFSLEGKYTFSTASGTQMNGSVSLSSGTWSYEGDKTNIPVNNGSYTVSGSKITFKWEVRGMELSETFTITINEDGTAVWKSDSTQISDFFTMLFNLTDTELTLEYSK